MRWLPKRTIQRHSINLERFTSMEGVLKKNTHNAIYWYRKAARKGHYDAKVGLIRLNSNWLDKNDNIDADIDCDSDT